MRCFALSEIGNYRKRNEDSYSTIRNNKGEILAIVCDGVGGSNAGDIASFETVKYFNEIFAFNDGFDSKEDAVTYFDNHIAIVNNNIFTLSTSSKNYKDMATTLTAVYIGQNFILGFNIGDSRIYINDINGKVVQISEDHNRANDLIKNHNMSYQEAYSQQDSDHITKAIGSQSSFIPDYYDISFNVKSIFLTSDGLHDYINNDKIECVLNKNHYSISTKAKDLINIALKNGSRDNVTLILIEMEN